MVCSISNHITGANVPVLLKSVPGFCKNLCAMSCALYHAILPFLSLFLTNVHLFPIGSLPSGRSTSSHVPIVWRVFNSSNIASCHCGHSTDSFAPLNDCNSSSLVLLSCCPDRNTIAISAVVSLDFCFTKEDVVGLVMSSGTCWVLHTGCMAGLLSV